LIYYYLIINIHRGGLSEILCKPKILPLKSAVLEQLQKIERAVENADENDFESKQYK
jgi:hypothetical protein